MSESTCVGHPWLNRSRPADSSKYSLPSRKSRFAFIASRCRRGLTAPPPSPTKRRPEEHREPRSRRHQREALAEVDREPGPRHVPD